MDTDPGTGVTLVGEGGHPAGGGLIEGAEDSAESSSGDVVNRAGFDVGPDLHKVKEISGFWLMFALVAGLQVIDLGH
ncbi:hypothetical protein Y013_25370 (plasmid) [Rhodococcus pyridinivorans SB3094]|uniref:Uncharacterized protein n=1 Tax=Rhodococcus pyridinivorans SB3094 TaxID=1435356 RepID=V9XLI3_9NOCA|nr:hypothetical protein Y013_25370 [Rhodococcus pyridinivorans SB3094]